jgi:hypothetical protein
VLEWVLEAEALGAGEILLNSIDRDGTRRSLRQLLRDSQAQKHKPRRRGPGFVLLPVALTLRR